MKEGKKMKRFYRKEQYRAYAEQQILNSKDAIKAIDILIETIKLFDGKILNVRFKNKANADLKTTGFDHTFISLDEYGTTLYCRDSDNYKVSEFTYNYINYTHILAKIKTGDDKRILSTETVEAWEKNKEYKKESIDNLTHDLKNLDKIEKEYKQIKASIEKFNTETTKSYLTRELFKFR